jgi:hypothetical protein
MRLAKLNLKGKSKKWFKKLAMMLANWPSIKVVMLLKYCIMDKEEIKAKLDQIKQKPKQRV